MAAPSCMLCGKPMAPVAPGAVFPPIGDLCDRLRAALHQTDGERPAQGWVCPHCGTRRIDGHRTTPGDAG